MIIAAMRPAEGSPFTEGWVDVRLTDSQRAWIVHALRCTPAPAHDLATQDLAVSCVVALGGAT